jgi:hypothetical protein
MIVSFGYLYKITEHLNIFNDFENKTVLSGSTNVGGKAQDIL